ncbi:MAG: CotH kinase family protein, partial [Candidatus Sericytochromatia bacterium]
DLSKVTEAWPLIRYLMDDPIYKSKYVKNIEQISKTSFNISKTKDRYQKAHDLIKPYVIGNDGEQDGYTLLQNKDDFEKAFQELNVHLEYRHRVAKSYLEANK